MPWSTHELAELAGTTLNTIRYYHRIGLLDEPERRYNGYKQYEVRHLVSLLRSRRLAELGVPLAKIGEVSAGHGSTADILRDVDGELQATIQRLQKVRGEIAAILRYEAPADVPAGFEAVASRLSEADSSMIHIYTQLYDDVALADLHKMIEANPDDLDADIDQLPSDADEETRQILVDRLTQTLARNLVDYPWLREPETHLTKHGKDVAETFVTAVLELYNPAQVDVLARASLLAADQVRAWKISAVNHTDAGRAINPESVTVSQLSFEAKVAS